MTTRDQVWDAALETVTEHGRFQRSDLDFDEEQRHTVRRTLRRMEANDWLTRTSKYSPVWRAGPKAKEILVMDGAALEAADRGKDEE